MDLPWPGMVKFGKPLFDTPMPNFMGEFSRIAIGPLFNSANPAGFRKTENKDDTLLSPCFLI